MLTNQSVNTFQNVTKSCTIIVITGLYSYSGLLASFDLLWHLSALTACFISIKKNCVKCSGNSDLSRDIFVISWRWPPLVLHPWTHCTGHAPHGSNTVRRTSQHEPFTKSRHVWASKRSASAALPFAHFIYFLDSKKICQWVKSHIPMIFIFPLVLELRWFGPSPYY